jgi:hypothetical protein
VHSDVEDEDNYDIRDYDEEAYSNDDGGDNRQIVEL